LNSEARNLSPVVRLRNVVFVRLIGLSLLLIIATILATIVTRVLVPPAPSARHQCIILKNLLLPIILVWLYGRAVRFLEQREPRETSLRQGTPLFFSGGFLGIVIIGVYVLALRGIGDAHLTGGTSIHGALPALNELLVPWLTAVGEELIFRLVLFRLAEEAVGTGLALLISAFLFGLSHVGNPGANPANLLLLSAGIGVLLALAFAATGNLWFPVGLHMGWNLAEGCIFGLPNSGQRDPVEVMHTTVSGSAGLTGGAFGPEGSILLFALTLVVSTALTWLTLRRNRWQPMRLSLSGPIERA
jgi:membrane protease YdiL (CAAX protease family)